MTVLYIILLIVCAGLAVFGIAYISSKIGVFLVDTFDRCLHKEGKEWPKNRKSK